MTFISISTLFKIDAFHKCKFLVLHFQYLLFPTYNDNIYVVGKCYLWQNNEPPLSSDKENIPELSNCLWSTAIVESNSAYLAIN